MRRVNVVGTSGSGKSTVAAAIAAKLAVPQVELRDVPQRVVHLRSRAEVDAWLRTW